MAPGVNHFNRIRKELLTWHPEYVERSAWIQVFLSILTQLGGEASFPSYNVVLGFWGLYVAFTRSFQACNCYLWFLAASILLDIIYCSVWGSNKAKVFDGPTAIFCLVMLIFNMGVKAVSLLYFKQLHKTLVAELTDRALRPANRRASINLALKQARKEGGRGSVTEMTAEEAAAVANLQQEAGDVQGGAAAGGYDYTNMTYPDQGGAQQRSPVSSPGSLMMSSPDQSPDHAARGSQRNYGNR
ncbi:hypothetical protein JKP88DRAFT_168733 [Tribonema minus]|uniref:Uncharacterized protein n=1 Tax=Tribonema minus TaxID=303371 RepID=A0A835YRK6_9STRA|nr:hypothetical protein JKP88DRAFT_168733 [Tribonema minus]